MWPVTSDSRWTWWPNYRTDCYFISTKLTLYGRDFYYKNNTISSFYHEDELRNISSKNGPEIRNPLIEVRYVTQYSVWRRSGVLVVMSCQVSRTGFVCWTGQPSRADWWVEIIYKIPSEEEGIENCCSPSAGRPARWCCWWGRWWQWWPSPGCLLWGRRWGVHSTGATSHTEDTESPADSEQYSLLVRRPITGQFALLWKYRTNGKTEMSNLPAQR